MSLKGVVYTASDQLINYLLTYAVYLNICYPKRHTNSELTSTLDYY